MLEKLIGKKYSIYKRILIYVGASMALILVCMELFCVLTIKLFQEKVASTYQDTVDFYADYWGTRLRLADQSLLVLLNSACDDYFYATNGERTALEYELAKLELKNEIEETGIVYSNQLLFFYYMPERGLYVCSSYTGASVAQTSLLENIIAENIQNDKIDYGRNWTLLDVEGEKYLYQIYLAMDGYCGAAVSFADIIRGMDEIIENTNYVTITDENGLDLIGEQREQERSYYPLKAPLDMTSYKLTFMIERMNIYKQMWLITLLTVVITAVVVYVLIHSIRFQMKMLMVPLTHLNWCMLEFGKGNTQVRADGNQAVQEAQEVQNLLCSFNEMAEQITNLKISIYESELERQKIRYNYLKVQIQPHFYTNVLNLIYGLAEVGKYADIQMLSLSMAKYFRYLMDDKDDFVALRRELDCVSSYVEIQQLRYGGMVQFGLYAMVDTDRELIPPIVIQTFVENSIKYNITMIKELSVDVVIEKQDEMLCISITDNGCGFPEELIRKLSEKQDISVDGKHIGIRNVQMRIDALYEGRASMKIRNNEEKGGAMVYLTIPSQMLLSDEKGRKNP